MTSSSFDPGALKSSSSERQWQLSDLLAEGIYAMTDI